MTRPSTHRNQDPPRRCGNCIYALYPEHKDDLLCFHGDSVTRRPSCLRGHWVDIELADGRAVGLLDGDEYDQVWGGRVVDESDICDEWFPKIPH